MCDFRYVEDTPVLLNGKRHMIRMENGMTGIGSREWWLDGEKMHSRILQQSDNISDGEHQIYYFKWRDTPWDKCYIIVSHDEVPKLLAQQWREPRLFDPETKHIDRAVMGVSDGGE